MGWCSWVSWLTSIPLRRLVHKATEPRTRRREDYQVALVTYRAACERWPGTPITLRQGARVRTAGACALPHGLTRGAHALNSHLVFAGLCGTFALRERARLKASQDHLFFLGMSSHMPLFSAVARHTMHAIEDYYCDSKQ
jgi:hypothetical protein